MREGRLPPPGVPTHTPNPGALKVWDGDATNPIGDATNPLHPVGAMLLGSPNPIKGGLQLGVCHPWGLPSPFWGAPAHCCSTPAAKTMGGGPHAERTRVPSPGTHLRVLVEENFVPGHGHEELVLEAPQLQEAALIRGLRGIGGVWGHGGPLRSFPLALLRHLLQGLHPLVAVGCGVGAQRGQGWGWGGSSKGPGGCQEEGSSPKMGSGPAARGCPPSAHRHSRPERRSCGWW